GDWRWMARELRNTWPTGCATPGPSGKLIAKDTSAAVETTFAGRPDRSIGFQGKPIEKTEIRLPLTAGGLAAIRIELLPHDAHGGSILRGDDETTTFSFSTALRRAAEEKRTTVSFYKAEAD